jgi:transposase
MIALPLHARIYAYVEPVDFRKSFDGLAALIDGTLGLESTSGAIFLFLNRRASQVKMLFWDRDGYCIVMKRLECGTFRRVGGESGVSSIEIERAQLALLLDGIDARVLRRRKRYSRQ